MPAAMAHGDPAIDPVVSLLDRLADGAAAAGGELAAGARMIRSLARDLEWLLNGRHAAAPAAASTGPPDPAALGVLGWGLPDLTDLDFARDVDRHRLARHVEAAIRAFEPRLRQVRVEPLAGSGGDRQRTTLRVDAVVEIAAATRPLAFDTVITWADRRVAVREENQ